MGGEIMKIDYNGTIRDMTKSELAEWSKQQAELDAMPKPEPTESEMIHNLQIENAELIKRIEKIEKDIEDLQFESGGSVKPGGDIPYDPKPSTGGEHNAGD